MTPADPGADPIEALQQIASADGKRPGQTSCRWCGWAERLNPTHNDDCPTAIDAYPTLVPLTEGEQP